MSSPHTPKYSKTLACFSSCLLYHMIYHLYERLSFHLVPFHLLCVHWTHHSFLLRIFYHTYSSDLWMQLTLSNSLPTFLNHHPHIENFMYTIPPCFRPTLFLTNFVLRNSLHFFIKDFIVHLTRNVQQTNSFVTATLFFFLFLCRLRQLLPLSSFPALTRPSKLYYTRYASNQM